MRRGRYVTLVLILIGVAVTPALAQDSIAAQKVVTPVLPPNCDGCIYDSTQVGYPQLAPNDPPFEPKAAGPLSARNGAVELPGTPGLGSVRGQLGNPAKSGLGSISVRGGAAALSPAEEAGREIRSAIRKLG